MVQKIIQNARLAKHMTRDDLAKALGKSRWTVKAWEIGKRRPRTQDLAKIAQVLGVPITDLFKSDEEG